jgi:hypothetical protein
MQIKANIVADPAAACPNPPSTTRIICIKYSGVITQGNFTGATYQDFQIVMAGTNAYNRIPSIVLPPVVTGNWTAETYTNGGAIEAPIDCAGNNTYVGVAKWYDGNFDAQRCVDTCATNSDCHFVNTYFQRRNGTPYVQHCALYTRHWPAWYATNVGQTRGDDNLTVQYDNSFG